jgi:hypothetical protein
MIRFSAVVLAVLSAECALAQSPTYRCVDENGRSTYTNIREETTGKKCTVVSREVSVVPVDRGALPPQGGAKPAAQGPGASAQPAQTAANRANDRRKILEEELDGEQKRLAEARTKLVEEQNIRNGDEKNYQRVLDRLKPFVETVERHEKNVEQLRRELANLR